MERRINRRRQGDLGEASAIDWLTRQGATISVPFGHSPDYDLIAEIDGRLLRVQVKTSVCRVTTPNGHERWNVGVRTNGGNQSWSGITKRFDPAKVDALFVLVGDGRRWCIPASEVEGRNALILGGPKYSEFEIEPAGPIDDLVYGEDPPLESKLPPGEYASGQRTRSVKAWAYAFAGSNPASPMSPRPTPSSEPELEQLPVVERGTAPHGQTRVSGNRQIVIPKRAFEAAALSRGDRLKAVATGSGEVVFRRVARERGGLDI